MEKTNIMFCDGPILKPSKLPTTTYPKNNARRQYFGYVNSEGNRIIYTTFNWDRYTLRNRINGHHRADNDKWKREKEMVLDGCSYHWEIKINLDTEELFELDVNGLG